MMKVKSAVTAIILLFLLLVVFIAVKLQVNNEKEMISLFRQNQFNFANQASKLIESNLNELSQEIQHLSTFCATPEHSEKDINRFCATQFEHLKNKSVKSISIYGNKGLLKYSIGNSKSIPNLRKDEIFNWETKCLNNRDVLLSDLVNTENDSSLMQSGIKILMFTPILKNTVRIDTKSKANNFAGIIVISLDLVNFLDTQFSFINDNSLKQELWVIDKNGLLLFNSTHPEMIMHNIKHYETECQSCHSTFDYYKPLFSSDAGNLDYKTKYGGTKLASFISLNFKNANWEIVASNPYEPITNFIAYNFQQTILLISLVFIALLLSFSLLYYNYKLKIKAEEETKQFREKEVLKEKIENSERKYKNIFENAVEGILQTSSDGMVINANPAMAEMLGYDTKEEFINSIHNIENQVYVDPERRQKFKRIMESDGRTRGFEFQAYRKDTTKIWLSNSGRVVKDESGNTLYYESMLINITTRKKAVQKIYSLNEELNELIKTRDKFFTVIAHDLRSPFQGMICYSQLLDEEFDSISESERKDLIQRLNKLIFGTYKLLGKLLEWSGIQTGKISYTPEVFPLYKELKSTIMLLSQTALNKDISIKCNLDPDENVYADKNMISAVIRNLVSNSIKYTNPGGNIVVSSRMTDGFIEVTIEDNGVGIDQNQIQNLFNTSKNYSTKGTRNEEGTGLGLLLSKEMIHINKGVIYAESEINKGSRFIFKIPAQKTCLENQYSELN
jgi:PAS domain S-box-containing protein